MNGPEQPRRSLWRHRDFNMLWCGQSISVFGTAITTLALPTIAVLELDASPATVGVLIACQRLPYPLLALLVGAWADRLRRRPLMVWADAGRFLLLGALPVLDVVGHVTLASLIVVALLTGALSVVFDVAYMAYLPALVGPNQLVDATARLEVSKGAASFAGPGLAGVLVQVVGAIRAVAVDAVSYLASVVSLLAIRKPEVRPSPLGERTPIVRQIADGARFVFGDDVLRSLLVTMTLLTFLTQLLEPVWILFAYRTLGLSPGEFGAVLAAGGLGAIPAAMVSPTFRRLLGYGPGLAVTTAAVGVALLLAPLAEVLPSMLVLVPLVALAAAFGTINNVLQSTLRQTMTPDAVRGRMNALFRSCYWGAWPLGDALGGLLADRIGALGTICVAGLAIVLLGGAMLALPVGRIAADAPAAA